MDTEEEIRQREAQETNETPTVEDGADDQGDEGDGSSGYGGIPTPSISKKHLAIIGALVALYIAWRLYQSSSSSSGGSAGSLDEARAEDWEPTATAEADDLEREDIEVPVSQEDPLAGDQAVAEEFRKRGIIRDNETED